MKADPIRWDPLEDDGLNDELRGAAIGPRVCGERSACGRYLIALREPTHPLHGESWELYGRAGSGWSIKNMHPTRERAHSEAQRQADLALSRASSRCPCGDVSATETAHPECGLCETYRCPRCERWCPWSYGAADDTPALCDGCAAVVQEAS